MNLTLTLQKPTQIKTLPKKTDFQRWVTAALPAQTEKPCEITVRLVDEAESAALNTTYRGKTGPTNILSFVSPLEASLPFFLVGDLILCVPVVLREALAQHKPVLAHWAHLTVHGTLHLLGYDHQKAQEARRMEALEVDILAQLGFPNPY